MLINYVSRNAYFSINSGAKFVQITVDYYDYKIYYQHGKDTSLTVKLIRLTGNLRLITFVVVTNFNHDTNMKIQ